MATVTRVDADGKGSVEPELTADGVRTSAL